MPTSPKVPEVKKILTTEKSINYKSFYGSNPISPTSPAAVSKDIFSNSTIEAFNRTSGPTGNMDAWKMMVRDDVIRFENEQQEKKMLKK